MRTILDIFWQCRKIAVTTLAYISLWLYGSEARWRDLWSQTFPPAEPIERDLNKAKDLDLLLTAAKEALQAAESRRAGITDKCKTLLTISSFLVAVVGILLPKNLAFGSRWIQVAFFIAAIALFNAVMLLLEFFNVRAGMVVTHDQSDVELEPAGLKKSLIKAYFDVQADLDSGTDYLVEIYKAARFSFLSAFTMVILLFAITFFGNPPAEQATLIARQLRNDREFVAASRGEQGATGPKGDQGARGDIGPKGEPGENCYVNTDDVVRRILEDPRFKNTKLPLSTPPP